MNILVIGNGFDLAHGLPTKYTDFLGFVERFENLKKSSMIMSNGGLSNTAKPIYEYLDKLIFENRKLSFELDKLISSNIWIKYFSSNLFYLNLFKGTHFPVDIQSHFQKRNRCNRTASLSQ